MSEAPPRLGRRILLLQDHPQSMHDAGQPAHQRQQNIQPEVQPKSDLQENAEWRQQEGEKYADNVQSPSPMLLFRTTTPLSGSGFKWR